MSKFEFLSVLVSVMIGLGLAHLCQNVFQMAYRRRLNFVDIPLAGFTFMVLILNWWVFYNWQTRENWAFEDFLVLVLWAISFYGLAVSLFPPDSDTGPRAGDEHRWFGGALLVVVALDIVQTWMRGSLLDPWYYLPFVLQYAVCAVLLIYTKNIWIKRVVSWWLFLSITLWSLVVRRYLLG